MRDFRSLEHKIRDVMIAETEARNTAIRRKMSNVGRPEDNVKDETSKLAKQGEIKTKIIDEASDQQTDGAFMKDKDKGDKDNKKKPDAQDEDDPREIKGGKTEVDLKPTTNDSTEDTNKEDELSKKAKNKVNKEIGAKGVKEEMIKSHFGLPQSLIDTVTETLKGNQKKLDKNHNGKLDKQDFKMLRKEETVEEGNANLIKKIEKQKPKAIEKGFDYPSQDPKTADRKTLTKFHKEIKKFNKEEVEELDERDAGNKAKKDAAVAAVGAKNKDSQYLDKINPAVADKIRGREKMSGVDRKQYKEEVEYIEELDREGMVKRYADKARRKVEGGEESPEKRAAGRLLAGKKRWGGTGGIPAAKVPAVQREEIEQIDELSPATMHSYQDKAADSIAHSKRSLKRKEGDRVAHALEIKKRNKGLDLSSERLAKKEMSEEIDPCFSEEELARLEEIAKTL